jgi:hypothetical protein
MTNQVLCLGLQGAVAASYRELNDVISTATGNSTPLFEIEDDHYLTHIILEQSRHTHLPDTIIIGVRAGEHATMFAVKAAQRYLALIKKDHPDHSEGSVYFQSSPLCPSFSHAVIAVKALRETTLSKSSCDAIDHQEPICAITLLRSGFHDAVHPPETTSLRALINQKLGLSQKLPLVRSPSPVYDSLMAPA